MKLISLITRAFAEREAPASGVPAGHSDTDIYSDAKHFSGRLWMELNCKELELYHAAIFGFSNAAFCYFLPGIMCATLKEKNPNLMMVDAILADLDRLPQTGTSDEFLVNRWIDLSIDECRATQEWILWLSGRLPDNAQDVLLRAYSGLDILIAARTK